MRETEAAYVGSVPIRNTLGFNLGLSTKTSGWGKDENICEDCSRAAIGEDCSSAANGIDCRAAANSEAHSAAANSEARSAGASAVACSRVASDKVCSTEAIGRRCPWHHAGIAMCPWPCEAAHAGGL
jgi:hypothetical protein